MCLSCYCKVHIMHSDCISQIYSESSYHWMINIVVNTKEINGQYSSKPQGGDQQPRATKVPVTRKNFGLSEI
jgi:hypothetical protein